MFTCYFEDYVYSSLFADDTCIYATDRKEVYVFRELQRGLSAIMTWYERWNIKINQDATQAIYFSHTLRPPVAHLTLNGRRSAGSLWGGALESLQEGTDKYVRPGAKHGR
jgi:hypothetical protein